MGNVGICLDLGRGHSCLAFAFEGRNPLISILTLYSRGEEWLILRVFLLEVGCVCTCVCVCVKLPFKQKHNNANPPNIF